MRHPFVEHFSTWPMPDLETYLKLVPEPHFCEKELSLMKAKLFEDIATIS